MNNIDIKKEIQQIYLLMRKLNLISSQVEFSTLILGKSKKYYSTILSNDKKQFSVNALSCLSSQLDCIQNDNTNPIICDLFNTSIRCLDRRVKELYIPYNYFKGHCPLKAS